MSDLVKLKDILKDKLVIRIDKTINEKDKCWDFIIIFVVPEKKFVGHCIVRMKWSEKKELKVFKKILIDRFKLSITGFKNWIKLIEEI